MKDAAFLLMVTVLGAGCSDGMAQPHTDASPAAPPDAGPLDGEVSDAVTLDAPGEARPLDEAQVPFEAGPARDASVDGASEDAGLSPPWSRGVCVADEARVASGFSVHIPILENDALEGARLQVEIQQAPAQGEVVLEDGGRLAVYRPRRGYAGADRFAYRVLVDFQELGSASVDVVTVDAQWVVVEGEVYEIGDVEAGGGERSSVLSEVWDVCGDGAVVGRRGPGEGEWRASAWSADGSLEPALELDGQDSALLGCSGEDEVVGYLRDADGGRRGFWGTRTSPASITTFAAEEAADSVLYGRHGEVAVGGLKPSAGAGGSHERALTVQLGDGGGVWETADLDSEGDARFYGVDAQGTRVGARWLDGEERALLAYTDQDPQGLEIEGMRWSRAHDLDDEGRVVGTTGAAPTYVHGFLWSSGGQQLFDAPGGLQTHLLGIGPRGELAGYYTDALGARRGFVARPLPESFAGGLLQLEPEAPNSGIDHACSHTTIGPFVDAVAGSSVEGAPAITRAHTNYRIALPAESEGVHRGVMRYRVTSPGLISFFVFPRVPLRVRHETQGLVEPTLAEPSSRCAGIAWLHQLQVTEVGEFVIELGPTEVSEVSIVYERSWAVL